MNSLKPGKSTLEVEVQEISRHGIWLYVMGREYFLPYKIFPWFENAKVSDIYHLELHHKKHLYWPNLDIDLELESLQAPEKYPLVYK